jgi:hypothetical protein
MNKGNLRVVLYFDLAMSPHPSDSPPLPLNDFIHHLERRWEQGVSRQVIDNERRVVRLADIRRVDLRDKTPAVAMLFSLGDKDKAVPGFTNFETGRVRIVPPRAGEAGGLSVHALVCLEPSTKGGHFYRMVYEDVNGFGRSVIQGFLRSEFKIISDEQGLTFRREGGSEVKTRPLVELSGHASDQVKNSLAQGRLLHVELVSYVEKDLGFDEARYIKMARQDISFTIAKSLPEGDGLTLVEKIKVWAFQNGYESMRIRWRDPDMHKPQSAKIDTGRQDAGEALFVKSAEIGLRNSLPDISEQLSDELVKHMATLLED